ncbi:hypothetical protein COZ71_08545, partial [Candidatus Desantisbacteria bacterium CG_4_8_14_3_um_filter_40_12]
TLGKTVDIIRVVASSGGSFTTSFTVDSQRYGTQTITVVGINSGYPVNSSFYITPEVVSVTPTKGTVGTFVTVSGTGYGVGEVLRIDFSKTVSIVTGAASDEGTFTLVFTVDTQGYATKTITVEGINTLHLATNSFFILPEIVQITPITGTVGTLVTINCTGYGTGEVVRLDFGKTTSIATPLASSDGTFTVVFTVDTQAYATRTVRVEGVDTKDARDVKFYIIPEIVAVVPDNGTVGTFVTVTGSGYGASEGMMVDFGLTTDIISGVTSNDGTFSLTFTVDTQRYGTKTIVAEGIQTQYATMETFCITPQIISVKPSLGTVGTVVTITGSGYEGLENVRVDFGKIASKVIGITNINGTFTAMFMVDTQAYGTRTITGTGLDSTAVAENSFYITPEVINVTPASGTVGSFVTVKCSGYGAGEVVRIGLGNTQTIAIGAASSDGTFTVVWTVDAQRYATRTVVAEGVTARHPASNSFYVLPEVVSVTPNAGTVGTIVTISGTGYGSNDSFKVNFGKAVAITTGVASNDGTITAVFTINIQAYGTTSVVATSLSTKDKEGNYITQYNGFKITTTIYISPSEGTVGIPVTVNGYGYGADEDVQIDFGTTISIVIAHTSMDGTFTTVFVSNPQKAGNSIVTATGLISQHPYQRSFDVTAKISQITPVHGTVGTRVTVVGDGFGSEETVRIDFGGTMTIAQTSVSLAGTFSIGWTVDTQKYGTTTITAYGLLSNARPTKVFKIEPEIISVTPTMGTVGKLITIVCSGYGDSEVVQIDFGNIQSIVSGIASNEGTFTASFTVDTQVFGTTTIMAVGMGEAINVFRIIPEVYSVVPTTGTVGAVITIQGTGYAAEDVIIVAFGTNASIQQAVAGDKGWFSTSFTVDIQSYGTTTITASGANSATNIFFILPQVVSVSPTTGTVGMAITINGTGYAAGDNIRVAFGTKVSMVTTVASQHGSFTTSWTVDVQRFGTTTIIASGVGSATNIFCILPQVVSVTPTTGTVGTVVTILGNGYAATDSITVLFGSNPGIQMATASIHGSFTTRFTVNTQAYGTTTITASGVSMATNIFRILPELVSVVPNTGTVGSLVTISCTGYGPSNTIRLSFGTTNTLTTAKASSYGTMTTVWTVNTQSYGTTSVVATSLNTKDQAGNYITSLNMFKITTVIYITPTEGTVGTNVTVTGNGYGVSETVGIDFGTTMSIVIAQSTASGTFIAVFTTDPQSGMTIIVKATGVTSQNPYIR